MRKRKLVKQIASISLSLAMVMGSLSNVPMTAQAADIVTMADLVTETNNTSATGEIDYDALNAEIYDNLEDYPVGNLKNDDVIFEDALVMEDMADFSQLIEGTTMSDGQITSAASNPSAADNSTNENAKYLPPVLNQYGGSCTHYSYVYAVGSYILNQARDKSSQLTSNVLSPLFTYNMLRADASTSYGTVTTYPISIMTEIGAATAEYAPITTSYKNYPYTWYATEEAWNSATENRVESVIRITDISHSGTPITGPNDSDLDLIKSTLASGKIIGFSSGFYTYNYTVIPSSSPSHAGEYAVDRGDYVKISGGYRNYGNHSMVIVGYDDNIWIDVNRDGKQQTAEFGALKIMNSHGTGYRNSGYVWVAYDVLNKVSAVITTEDQDRVNAAIDAGTMTGSKIQNAYREEFFSFYNSIYTYTASSEESASSNCRLVATLNTNDRQDIQMYIIAKNNSTGVEKTYKVPVFRGYAIWSSDYALDGSKSATDGTIVIDLDNVISDITPKTVSDYTWSVKLSDLNSGTTPLTVKDLHIKVDGVMALSADVTNNSLNGSTATYTMAKETFEIVSFTSSKAPEKTTETEQITFNAQAKGGSNVEYQFVFKTTMDETIIRDYSSDPTCTWVAEHSFYLPSIVVNARDGKTGEVVSKSMDFGVNKAPLISGCTITSGEMNLGESKQVIISFGPNAKGTGELKYVIEYSYNGGAKTVYYSSTNRTNVYWTPDKAGTYKLWLSLEDENGIRDTREATIKVVSVNEVSIDEFTVSANSPVGLTDVVDFSAVASLGSGNYEYRFGTIFEGKEYEISNGYQSYSTSTNFRFSHLIDSAVGSAKAVGTHTLFVDVRDVDTGKVVRKTIENFEVKPLEISSFTATPTSSQKVGKAVEIYAETKYEAKYRYNAYGFYVIKDGIETSLSGRGANYMSVWIPTEPGIYTLKFFVRDYLGQEATATMEYVVEDENANQTTIYYGNSWSQAYIHYKVGNGAWTTVPGVKMASDSSKIGYQWKYVIDMGDATSATVCFNNGNGTWDSKNGANYTVGVGTYGIKNNTVKEINDELTLTLSADKPVGGTFTSTQFTAHASNGTEPYTYQYALHAKGDTNVSYGYATTSNTYNFITYTANTYTLYVKVTDAAGKVVEKSMDYVVEGPKFTTFTATAADHKVGTPVILNAEVSNVQFDVYNRYSFVVEKNGKIFFDEATGGTGNATWTPTEAGIYTITAKYRMYDGTEYKTTMTYEVVEDSSNETTIYYSNSSWSQAYIHYQVGNGTWTTAPGVKMSNNTSGNGYTWKYFVDLGDATNVTVCFNNGNGSWDSKNGANYKLGVGTYGIKNNTINELEDKLSVSVKADKAVGGTFTTTKFTATAVNGTAPYTYKLAIVKASVTPTDSNYFSISDTGVYNYTPYTEGNYTVYAKVTDANGKTAVTSMSYTIEGPKFKTFTATATDKKVGTPVTLTAEFVNVQYDRYNSYSFEVEKDGVVAEYYADSTGTYVWTPTEAGTYTITAKFTTYLGTVYEKEMTYEVSNGNTVTIYYNTSWSNANIHYCIAGGSWTAVPGVAMTKTSEKSGYTHKIVIDLGDATSVTACFNNGNGTWDSKNGSNYTISAGTYGVSNGSVYKLN